MFIGADFGQDSNFRLRGRSGRFLLRRLGRYSGLLRTNLGRRQIDLSSPWRSTADRQFALYRKRPVRLPEKTRLRPGVVCAKSKVAIMLQHCDTEPPAVAGGLEVAEWRPPGRMMPHVTWRTQPQHTRLPHRLPAAVLLLLPAGLFNRTMKNAPQGTCSALTCCA
jgi:hypothetical protein